MRLDLCRRLKKVVTPFEGNLRTAGSNLLKPVGLCTARIIIQGLLYSVQFVVLSSCTHEIILGWDFLSITHAIIFCGNSQLSLQELPDDDQHVSALVNKVRASEDTVITPRSSSFVLINCCSLSPGDYFITPTSALLEKKGLLVPRGIAHIGPVSTYIIIINVTHESILIPENTVLGTVTLATDINIIALNDTPSSQPFSQDPIKENDVFDRLPNTIDGNLTGHQRAQMLSLLKSYHKLFDLNDLPLGTVSTAEHRIDTQGHSPIRTRPYRVSMKEREIIEQQVTEMLQKEVIRKSSSPWSSPVVLVKKKDGSIRFCVDYRRLNKITTKDVYPIPRIDDALDCLQGAEFFTSLDLKSGYWQIPMNSTDKPKTAFITPDGLYEFNVMPFGLCNAPATFERLMDTVLRGLKWQICLCYLDDIIIFAPTFAVHLERVATVLSCIANANLKLNTKKCHFAAREIKVLGHVVSNKGVRPDPDKIRAVTECPIPKTVKELRSFLGLCSYFRRFVQGFATIAAPLHTLLDTTKHFHWTPECQHAFNQLVARLTQDPIMCHFDPSAPTEIHTDASGYGIGAVLIQRKSPQLENVVAYASRTLSKAERNYSTTEKECLAIIWATAKFRPYLYGRHFNIITDHHALCWLTSLKDPSGRLGRWSLRLQEYDFSVTHRSGRKHQDADALSRCPLPTIETQDDDNPITLASLSLDTVAQEQLQDPGTAALVQHITGASTSDNRKFCKRARHFSVRDGLLYRRNYSTDGQRWLLALPRQLRMDVLRCFHDDPTSGHLGISKTYQRVRGRYYWSGMYRSIQKYVRSCLLCQQRKQPPQQPAGLLQPILVPEKPFERVGIDLYGPLPKSSQGNHWVVVAIDHLTRYAETAALPHADSREVASFILHSIVLRHGSPRELLSDRGTVFLSQVVENILRECNVIHRCTSAYHPQTNGLTERFNRTLSDMLSMYVSQDHDNWDRILPFITFAYNTATQDTTHYSPFILTYNREVSCTMDTILRYRPDVTEHTTFAEDMNRAEECRQLARFRTSEHQNHEKHRYDDHHRSVTYNNGDLVWVWMPMKQPGLSSKLLRKYHGPYKVLESTSPVNYKVEPVPPPSDRRRHHREIVHVSRMKPYFSSDPPTPSARMAAS